MSDEQKSKSLGATPHAGGVAFRVWAPHAQRVAVLGSFNDWNGDTHPMQGEENGLWYADVAEAHIGDQYRYLLTTATGEFKRIDPYAREVTNSVGNAISSMTHISTGRETTSLSRRGTNLLSMNCMLVRSTSRRTTTSPASLAQ